MILHKHPRLLPILLALVLITGCTQARFNPLTTTPVPQPGLAPQRIILNLTQTPATSQAVTWRTTSIVTTPKAEIAKTTGSPVFRTRATTVTASSESIASNGSPLFFYHSATFKDLEPNTLYAYRVGDGTHWSEWNQFKTAAATPQPFSFVYFGDPQEEVGSMCARTFRTAYQKAPNAAFWHFVGDMVDNGDQDSEWQELFDAFGWIPRTTPFILLPGNHAYPDKRFVKGDAFKIFPLWRPQFTLPRNGPKGLEETAYAIDYQGVRFIMLNGNEKLQEQAKWLDTVLSNNPQPWTIAAIHQPLYSTGRRKNDQHRQELFVPVFDKYSVDLVLQGHEHTYTRTKQLFNNQPATAPHRGTVYVTSVSGPKSYPVNHRYDHLTETIGTGLQLFQVIRIDGKNLTYEAFDSAGNPYDRVELNK